MLFYISDPMNIINKNFVFNYDDYALTLFIYYFSFCYISEPATFGEKS